MAEQLWVNANTSTVTEDYQYTYDADGNVLTITNLVNTAFSEQYGYNGGNEITSFTRGTSETETWTYDALGNWTSETTNGVEQTRSANAQNEYTAISGDAAPTYDNDGNTTADGSGKTYVYDAWNRIVQANQGSTTLSDYSYDALGRQVTKGLGASAVDLFFSAKGQVLEDPQDNQVTSQYVWSPMVRNGLVEGDLSTGGGTLNERLWALQDANENVTGLVNNSGNLVERYTYDSAGNVTYLTPSWTQESSSAYGWTILYQGELCDPTGGLYLSGGSGYNAPLGRCMTPISESFQAGGNFSTPCVLGKSLGS